MAHTGIKKGKRSLDSNQKTLRNFFSSDENNIPLKKMSVSLNDKSEHVIRSAKPVNVNINDVTSIEVIASTSTGDILNENIISKNHDTKMAVHLKTVQSWAKEWPWLGFTTTADGAYIAKIFCKSCREMPSIAMSSASIKGANLKQMLGGQDRAMIDGTVNVKKFTCDRHNKSESHQRVETALFYKKQEKENKLSLIQIGFNKMNEADYKKMTVLFNWAYMLCKQELPFTMITPIAEIEKKNGVDIGVTYLNDKSMKVFSEHIASSMLDNLKATINECRYYSVIFDGSTNKTTQEIELLNVIITEKGCRNIHFLGIIQPNNATSQEILASINTAFYNLGLSDWKQHLVGVAADGAAINFGKKNGVVTSLKKEIPWLIDIHCIAHRLELAASDAFKDTNFQVLHDLIVALYYHFKKSSKRWAELVNAGEALDINVLQQSRVSGTRWLQHKLNALRVLERNYIPLLTYFKDIAARPGTGVEQSTAKGLIKQLEDFKIPLLTAFYQDVISPLSCLSLMLQKNNISAVDIMEQIEVTSVSLELLQDKAGPKETNLLNPITSALKEEFVVLKLKNQTQATEHLKKSRSSVVKKIMDCVDYRFSNIKDNPLFMTTKVLHIAFWPTKDRQKLADYGNDDIMYLTTHFSQLLQANGCDHEEIAQEWVALKFYIVNNNLHDLHDKEMVWQRIFVDKSGRFENVFQLVQIILVYPFSTCDVERMFSCMKRIMGDWRCKLSVNTMQDLIRISSGNLTEADWNPEQAINSWLTNGKRSKRPNTKPYGERKPCL